MKQSRNKNQKRSTPRSPSRGEAIGQAYHDGWLAGATDGLQEFGHDDDEIVRALRSIGAQEDEVTAELKRREDEIGGVS